MRHRVNQIKRYDVAACDKYPYRSKWPKQSHQDSSPSSGCSQELRLQIRYNDGLATDLPEPKKPRAVSRNAVHFPLRPKNKFRHVSISPMQWLQKIFSVIPVPPELARVQAMNN
jgi:hypothetical protein